MSSKVYIGNGTAIGKILTPASEDDLRPLDLKIVADSGSFTPSTNINFLIDCTLVCH